MLQTTGAAIEQSESFEKSIAVTVEQPERWRKASK
jgi:hypothetical protein